MVTICCLNPACPKPENQEGTKFCVNCGNPLTLLRNHYHPIRLLSDEGGFGRTYLAEDLDKLKEKCVIKQLTPQQQGTAALTKAKELFEGEAKQLQKLGKHSQIPDLLAYFEENGYLYLIQEYIEGKTLDHLYNRCWNEQEIREFLGNILPVFEFVHQNQVIHRDVKPKNMMRQDSDGNYILIDFGASREFQSTVMAKRGTMIGTQGFSPIEQLQEGEAYAASDLYSLGMTCFYLLTRIEPHTLFLEEGYSWLKNWQSYLKQPVKSDLVQILDKLIQKEWRKRYQFAREVIEALNLENHPISQNTVISPNLNSLQSQKKTVQISLTPKIFNLKGLIKILMLIGLGFFSVILAKLVKQQISFFQLNIPLFPNHYLTDIIPDSPIIKNRDSCDGLKAKRQALGISDWQEVNRKFWKQTDYPYGQELDPNHPNYDYYKNQWCKIAQAWLSEKELENRF